MAGLVTVRDYFRNALGVGVNAAAFSIKRLFDDTVLTSGSTATDADPATDLDGMLTGDETTIGYSGALKYSVTDPTTGAVRTHTSKSLGVVGAWRSIDVTRGWYLHGKGVIPGIGSELACSASGGSMIITVATGGFLGIVADHGLIYTWPASRTVTATASDPTNPRIDTVVLRFYPPGVVQEGRIDLVLLAGTPAASPVAPTLTQNVATYWEEPLADVRVDAAVAVIAVGKVTDRRVFTMTPPTGLVAGDTLYIDATGKLARLAKGTSGQYLKQGATIPGWDTLTADEIDGTVSQAEFGYLASVTSDIQTQLNAKQPLDTDLTAIATLTSAADKVPYSTGAGTWALGDFPAAARTLLTTPSSANLAALLSDETGSGAAVFATSPTLVTPALGTIASGVLTNATGLPISTGVAGLGTGVGTFLATPTSANLAAALTDETGSGANVFATSPTLVTPALGTPSAVVLTSATGLPLTTGVTGTLPIANGGTAGTTAATARTALGLVIGTDVEAHDATLTALAGLNSSAGLLVQTAADTFAKAFLANYLVIDVQGDSGAATATATTSYVTALSSTITLPTGTWTIYTLGYLEFTNTLADNVQLRTTVDGTAGTVRGRGANATAWRSLAAAESKVSVASGSRTVTMEYKGSSGTTNGEACWLVVVAIRTA